MPFFERATDFNINGGHFSDNNGNNAHLAPQSMRTRNGIYSPTQEYGIGHSYPRQYIYPSQFHYGTNFQHQMHYQHRNGWCDPPMEYYPQFSQQATFNPSASPPPPAEYGGWANSRSQMTGYPSDNYQYGHHRNVPFSPPTIYPPPTSYPAANHHYMRDTPHPALPQTWYPPQAGPPPSQATSYPARNNQYMGYHAPSHPGVSSSPPAVFQSPPTPTPLPSRAPVEQVSASQEFATVGVVAPAAVLWPVGIKDTPQSPLPVDMVHVVHSNRPRQGEQPSLAAPRPLVAGALTNNLNSVPAALSSAPPSANQALLSPATQRVERQDALMPPSISPFSTLVVELVPAKFQETLARVGNESIISDPDGSTAIVTENVLPEEVFANDPLIPKSRFKVKGWRRLVKFIKRQAKKFRKVH